MLEIKFTPTADTMKKLQEALSTIGESALPSTTKAINASLGLAQNTLSKYAAGIQSLDSIGMIKEPFNAQNIKFNRNKVSDFNYQLSAESEELNKLQNGTPQGQDFDMKTKYPYGNKSRISSKGTPYLIIPFRWGTPNKKNTKRRWTNFIPQIDYKLNVLPMEKTFRSLFTYKSKNAKGQLVDRMIYEDKNGNRGFADRIEDGQVDSPISKWSKLHYSAGMVRMGDKASGGSTYWSFRIITPFQPKDMWVRKGKPAIPPIDIESAWARTIKDSVLEYLEAGVKDDFGV